MEDHAIVRQGIAQIINQQSDMEVVGEAEDAPTGLSLAARLKPDFIISDITLKRGDGLQMVQTITSQNPKINVLVLSMHDESIYAQAVLRAGAKGYVMKTETFSRVLHALRTIRSGKIYLSEEMISKMIEHQIRGKADPNSSPVETLSDREIQVFQLISQWRKPRQIALELHLSVKTIEYYRQKIKEKLGLRTATELTQYATEWKNRGGTAGKNGAPIPLPPGTPQ